MILFYGILLINLRNLEAVNNFRIKIKNSFWKRKKHEKF